MKKSFIIGLLALSFIFNGCGCSQDKIVVENDNLDKQEEQIENNVDSEQNNNINEPITEDYFIEIGALDFQNKINSNDTYIFFVGRDTCPACRSFKPTAIEFSSKEKINIYYVNTTNFSDNDWNIMNEIANISYIPTIIISKNNQIIYNEYGSKSYDDLKNIVEKYINGD